MDVELLEDVDTEENVFQDDADYGLQDEADNDASMFDGERCGICMDVIIDRGVLDCCQHWFCFVCIDNWSTITNLCPLCQNEFQLITCVPVYDTIGSNNADDESVSRDDDWSVEGKNGTLSFPSYYIDENAVTCLDGDACKLRSASLTFDENLALDTSIACDSCDTWFHAFCVGFDTESTVESWLCPRCLIDEEHKLGANETENHHSVDTFSGKVSVSVADDGETAVVVSLLDQKPHVEQPAANFCPGFDKEHGTDQPRRAIPENSSVNLIASSIQHTKNLSNTEARDSGLSTSSVVSPSSLHGNHRSTLEDNATCGLNSVDDIKATSVKGPVSIGESILGYNAILKPNEGSTLAVPVDDSVNNIQVASDEREQSFSPIDASGDENSSEADFRLAADENRKRKSRRTNAHTIDQKRVRLASEGLSKETEVEENAEGTSGQPDNDAFKRTLEIGHESSSGNENVQLGQPDNDTFDDILSIVQGTELKVLHGNPDKKFSERRDAAGPRVKKIVRIPGEDKESSVLVQNLRKEIREAVQGKSSEDVGKNIFDQKLLAAFRAAVAVPDAEPVRKASLPTVKPNKFTSQRGKKRENLTKKIYSTASGKQRRQAWHRDRQVEFWKHRCPKTTASEKIDTLKSVLSLLKTGTEAIAEEKGPEETANNPILSRLYLADASVFPRKDTPRPLSAVETSSSRVTALTGHNKADNTNKTSCLGSAPMKSSTTCLDNKKNKSTSSSMKIGAVSNKTSWSAGSTMDSQKGKAGETNNPKVDKRKWALQVLARKTTSSSTSPGNRKQEDSALLKGNHPLLAQLPADMRPKLESCGHNRIPNSVRQAQLYRLAETLLGLTNISPIRKTAATELAVADAINIEREIAGRSKSKVVYLNLCGQELRRQKSIDSQSAVEASNPSTLVTASTERESYSSPSLDPDVEKALKSAGLVPDSPPSSTCHGVGDLNDGGDTRFSSLDPDVEKALKSAGLIPDSPPSSTCHGDEDLNDGGDENKARGKGPTDVLEIDPQPDLDIFGEFEYDIEDEDYIGASAMEVSKLQMEGGESKMKVVFSTLNTEKQDAALISETLDETSEKLASSCLSQSECQNGGDIKDVDNREPVSLPPDPTEEGGEEPNLIECEELYGPDKEPLFGKFPSNVHALVPEIKSDSKTEKSDPTNSVVKVDTDTQRVGTETNPKNKADKQQHEINESVAKKVEAYIKEHIRPLCKSGVITVDQYRWAVGKTTDKVMKYHSEAKNANFLIKEGEKVKKLAEQYVEAANLKDKDK